MSDAPAALVVDAEHQGLRLDAFLTAVLAGQSRSQIQRLIREGKVTGPGSTLRASTFVRSKAETASAVDENDLTTTCTSAGQPTLTLASSVGPLTVTYTDIDGNALGSANAGSSLLLTGVSGTIVANVTSSVGLVSQIVKVLGC